MLEDLHPTVRRFARSMPQAFPAEAAIAIFRYKKPKSFWDYVVGGLGIAMWVGIILGAIMK